MAELEIHYPDGLVGFRKLSPATPLIVGSDRSCTVQLSDPSIQPRHCTIRWTGRFYRVEVEPGVRNVRARGVTIGWAKLRPNDELWVGDFRFVVRAAPNELIHDSMELGLDLGQLAQSVELPIEEKPTVAKKRARPPTYYTPMHRSPLFVGILCGFALVAVVGLVLFLAVRRAGAQKQFDNAVADFAEGKFLHAIARFDRFLEDYPSSELAEKARVWRAIAEVRQFTDSAQPAWSNALAGGIKLVGSVGELSFFESQRAGVATLILKIAEGLAQSARDTKDRVALEESVAALRLFDRIAHAEDRTDSKTNDIESLIAAARYEIEKDDYRLSALSRMDRALAEVAPIEVYREHRRMYQTYPELRDDPDCASRRKAARELERSLVTFEPSVAEETAATSAQPQRFRTAILRLAQTEVAPLSRPIAVLVADQVYGLDAGTGEVLWRQPAGFAPAFEPVALPSDAGKFLVHRTRDQRLALVDGKTTIWQCSVASVHLARSIRPLIHDGAVYIPGEQPGDTLPGRLIVVRLSDGRLIGQFKFPQRLTASPVWDRRRDLILVLGEQATLYALSAKQTACVESYATDHEPAGIRTAPAIFGRLLFVVENVARDRARLQSFAFPVDENSTSLRFRQSVDLPGFVWHGPAARGGRLFMTTDLDHFAAFDLGADDDPKPLNLVAQTLSVQQRPDRQRFVLPTSEREVWTVGSALSLYRIRSDGPSNATPTVEVPLTGVPQRGTQHVGAIVIGVSARADGATHVMGVEAHTGRKRWDTILGVLPVSVQSDPLDSRFLVVASEFGIERLSVTDLSRGLVQMPIAAESTTRRTQGVRPAAQTVFGWRDGVLQWIGGGYDRLIWHQPNGPIIETRLPGTPHAPLVVFGKGVAVPGENGLLFWVDPRNGAELAEPFAAADPPAPIGPVTALDESTMFVVAGRRVFRVQLTTDTFPRLQQVARHELPGVSPTNVIALGGRVVMTHANELVVLRPADFAIVDRHRVGAPVSQTVVPLPDDSVLFVTDHNEIWCVSSTETGVRVRWRSGLPARPVRSPLIAGDGIWIALPKGELIRLSPNEGRVAQRVDVGQALVDGPWPIDTHIVTLGADGSLILIDRNLASPVETQNRRESK